MKKITYLIGVSSLCLITNAFAQTNTITNNFHANTTIQAKCELTANNIDFGNLNFINDNGIIVANGGFTFLCSKSVMYTLSPDAGYLNGFVHLMNGTNGSMDGINFSFRREDGERWSRLPNETINGVGTGEDKVIPIVARTSSGYLAKHYDPSRTNSYNYEAKPDNYTYTVTTIVTY